MLISVYLKKARMLLILDRCVMMCLPFFCSQIKLTAGDGANLFGVELRSWAILFKLKAGNVVREGKEILSDQWVFYESSVYFIEFLYDTLCTLVSFESTVGGCKWRLAVYFPSYAFFNQKPSCQPAVTRNACSNPMWWPTDQWQSHRERIDAYRPEKSVD